MKYAIVEISSVIYYYNTSRIQVHRDTKIAITIRKYFVSPLAALSRSNNISLRFRRSTTRLL